MPTTTSNGITLSYTDSAGSGSSGSSGRPVVLIHGWPLSGASWSEQVGALTDAGHRVITYDRRGFGESDKPDAGYDYDTFAADLAGLLEALEVTEATLVGFSMGGGEVARYLGTYGEGRVAGAVFAAAVPPYLLAVDGNPGGGLAASDVEEMKAGVRADRAGFLDGFTTTFFSADGELKVTEEQRQQALALAAPATDQAVLDCIDAFGRTDFRADLEQITVPTLVIHGDSDAIVPFEVSGERTAATVPGAQTVLLRGGPHGINVSHATEFTQALLDFLES